MPFKARYKRPTRKNKSEVGLTISLLFFTFPKDPNISLLPHNSKHNKASDLLMGLSFDRIS